MKKSECPKCENLSLDALGVCADCGYTHKLLCTNCAHYNKMNARFCGACGDTLTFKMYLKRTLHSFLPYAIRLRLKHFVTGLAFGTLLALFAFGAFP